MGNGGATPNVVRFGELALGLPQGDTFLLPIAFVVATALFAVPAGLLADRIGKKKILSTGLIVYGVGALAGSQSADLTQAMIALFVIGIGNACIGTMLTPLLADLIPHRRAAELIGLRSAITSFAQPVGSFLAGEVINIAAGSVGLNEAFRWSFIFAGVCILISAILMQLVRPKRPVPQD
jgi:MFS family permease